MHATLKFILVALSIVHLANAATTVINTDFESGLAATGLTNVSSHTPAETIDATRGINGSNGLNNQGDRAMASASRAIDQTITFSISAFYNGNNQNSGGALSFGWTKAPDPFNAYSGGGGTTVSSDHVMVGLASTATANAFRLSAVNNTHGGMGTGNFGSTEAVLTANTWYRLSGSLSFNGTTTFTFDNITLEDIGALGTSAPTVVLTGTAQNVVVGSTWTNARATFNTNRDRGFQYTDNYSVIAIPEPSRILMLSLGALLGLRRRRDR